MKILSKKGVTACLIFIMSVIGLQAQTPAFPTAEGYGMWATGGRGGKVVEVTNLKDDANGTTSGSLRWALNQYPDEPITVVFRLSGVIKLVKDLRCSRKTGTTLAGQTAPGDGICIRGNKVNMGGSENLIIRHIRFRIGLDDNDGFVEGGSLGIENAKNFIIDHCTFGWSGEENMTIYDNNETTIQWCILHEGLYASGHAKGARSYACQWGGQTATYHHNLLAHNYNRTPRFNGARSNDHNVLIDYVNNVNYNWGKENSAYGGDFDGSGVAHKSNMINNYYKPGPARGGTSYFVQSSFNSNQDTSQVAVWYMNGNIMEGSTTRNNDNYTGLDASYYTSKGVNASDLIAKNPFEVPYQIEIETAINAYNSVLQKAGAFPRDTVDKRIVNEVIKGTASGKGTSEKYLNKDGVTYTNNPFFNVAQGIIDNPSAVGGYPEYFTYNEITDKDHDGMDDAWETENGLDPSNENDRNFKNAEGYTNLEVYLNMLADEIYKPEMRVGVKKIKSENTNIYMDSSRNTLHVNSNNLICSASIYNVNGKLVGYLAQQNISNIGVESLSPGLYIIQMVNDFGELERKKFIK